MQTSEPAVYTTGSWQPFPGQEDVSSPHGRSSPGGPATLDGAGAGDPRTRPARGGPLRQLRGLGGPGVGARLEDHPEFKERMSRVQQFVDKFAPTELEVVGARAAWL